MAILEILVYPDPILKKKSIPVEKVDDSVRAFILDLEETMRNGPGGVGIAAPQVGRLERIVIVDVSSKHKISSHGCLYLINPEIVDQEGSQVGREGCMSVPDYTGNVARATNITVKALDLTGESKTYNIEGFEAVAVQHEMDHLDGLLFLDRLVSKRDSLFRRKNYKKSATSGAG
jgi:peptide deformylase